jgi:hypothetical protein
MVELMRRLLDPRLLFVSGCLLMLLAYWPGLQGGFVLDDFDNFVQLERFARGEVSWIGPIVSNGSGPLGRPLSMATFVATVEAGGHVPWAYKVGNLFLHLSIGALVGLLAAQCIRQDARLAAYWRGLAVFAAIWWLSLPVHVSTVLYAVQRMSQVSTVFLLLGMLAYIEIRRQLEDRPTSRMLIVLLPGSLVAFTLLGALGKENGLLLPLLCLIIEVTLFADAVRGRRVAGATMILCLGLPALAGIAGLAWLHERFLSGYEVRSFTLWERVLTQPRVLWDYVQSILVPSNFRLGVYQDDFPISKSLWAPITTVPAIAAWVAVVVVSLSYRRSAPLAAAGSLLFLAGHAMESTVLPLEIYFEHRNYLPSVGLLLAVIGLVAALTERIPPQSAAFRRLAPALPALLLGVLLVATHGRALVWASPVTLLQQSAENRPESPRIASILAAQSVVRGDLEVAMARIERLEELSPNERGSTALLRLVAYCVAQRTVPPELLEAAAANAQPRPSNLAIKIAGALVDQLEQFPCPGLDGSQAVGLLQRWIAALAVPPTTHGAWRFRYLAARMAAFSKQWDLALSLGSQAYEDSGWNSGVGVFAIQIANTMGRRADARSLIARFTRAAPSWDRQLQEAARRFETHAATQETSSP